MKVYGITASIGPQNLPGGIQKSSDGQYRVIVAEKSIAAACRAFRAHHLYVSESDFKNYGKVTQNKTELSIATEQGWVYVGELHGSNPTYAVMEVESL